LGGGVAVGRTHASSLPASTVHHVSDHQGMPQLDNPEDEQQKHRQNERGFDDGRTASLAFT